MRDEGVAALLSATKTCEVPEYKAKFDEATAIYKILHYRAVLIRPSFDKIAQGTSNTGKPRSPIEKKNHPMKQRAGLINKM